MGVPQEMIWKTFAMQTRRTIVWYVCREVQQLPLNIYEGCGQGCLCWPWFQVHVTFLKKRILISGEQLSPSDNTCYPSQYLMLIVSWGFIWAIACNKTMEGRKAFVGASVPAALFSYLGLKSTQSHEKISNNCSHISGLPYLGRYHGNKCDHQQPAAPSDSGCDRRVR